MEGSEERKSAEADYESDAEEVSSSRWTARRMEASDDDDDGLTEMEEVRERYRRSAIGLDGKSDGLGGAPEYDNKVSDEDELGEEEEEATEVVGGVELEEVSQEEGDEGELQEMVLVNRRKEKVERKEVFVPRSAWFYMHDDRFQGCSSRRSRGAMIGVKSSNCTEEQKWIHDKFEATRLQDKSDFKSRHQQERKKQSTDHRYVNTNNIGSLDNLGNQNKISRTFKGRGSIRYRPLVKSNNLNPLSKHLQLSRSEKLQERTASSCSRRVSSHASATSSNTSVTRMPHFPSTVDVALSPSDSLTSSSHGIFKTQGSNETHGRSNRYIPTSMLRGDKHSVSLPNSFIRRKTVSKCAGSSALNVEDSVHPVYENHFTYQPMLFPVSTESLELAGETTGFPFPTQKICQPYPIYITENRVSLLPPHPVIEQRPTTSTVQTRLPLGGQQTLHPGKGYQTLSKSFPPNSSVGTLPQRSNFVHDLVGRGSVVLQGGGRSSVQQGGIPAVVHAMQLAGLPYGAVGDHVPSMPPVGYVPQSLPGSRHCEMTRHAPTLAYILSFFSELICSSHFRCIIALGRTRAGTAKPYNSNRSPASKSAPQLVDNEVQERQFKPQRYSRMR